MTAIMVEWTNGEVECVDSAETESEAIYLVEEYRTAFNPESVNRVWMQEDRQEYEE